MILVRTGGLFGLIIAGLVAALFFFVVRPAINDTTDRAFDTANRALDEASRQSDEIRSKVEQSTISAGGDYLSATSLGAVVGQIKQELGPRAELLDLTVSKHGGGNVKYRTGDRAAGFQWGPGHEGLEPVKVTLIGSGKVADNVFPIAKLDAAATTKLTAAVKSKAGADFDVETMTLGLDPVTRAVQWTVTGDGDGRSLVFTAKSDASGVKRVN
jgi:hypothetical protein